MTDSLHFPVTTIHTSVQPDLHRCPFLLRRSAAAYLSLSPLLLFTLSLSLILSFYLSQLEPLPQTPLLSPPLHSFAFLSARSWIISTWQPSRPCLFSFPSKRTSNLVEKRADDHWLLTFSASI